VGGHRPVVLLQRSAAGGNILRPLP
jgi:hypothetical protein